MSEYKTIQKNLYQLAITDALTGVFNRRFFIDNLNENVERMRRKKNAHALLVVDIDDFKDVNDKHGHVEGDKMLCFVSKCCQSACRSSDYVCRYGGDEFLILLHNITEEDALNKANQICQQVQDKITPNTSVSIGVTLVRSQDTSIDTIVKRADKALYQAKAKGKGCAELI
ncbi:MAG: GGDEF domain-containing protein [Gammaproteobacteria bacterium]|nr:GGDEF domain-containing protein [Gammaproteobacteria bacterium]